MLNFARIRYLPSKLAARIFNQLNKLSCNYRVDFYEVFHNIKYIGLIFAHVILQVEMDLICTQDFRVLTAEPFFNNQLLTIILQ